MIITLSSMIDVPKICIRTKQRLPDKHKPSPKPCGKHSILCGFPRSAIHHAGLSLVSPVVTLAEAAEYSLDDFSYDPEYGDYHYYFHTAIYFYVITYLYTFVLQLIEPVLVLFDVCHDNGCRQRPQRNISACIDADKLQFLLDFLWQPDSDALFVDARVLS